MRHLLSLLLVAAIGFGGVAQAADKTKIEKYPAEAVKSLYEGCAKAKDVPADKVKPVCTCYAIIVQGTIPYAIFQKTGAELKAKGFEGLDADGKAALEKNGYAVNYCRLKHDAVGTAEERATFPTAALPALHASCMQFKDIAEAAKEKFCGCYESVIRTKISYADWQLLGLAIQTKGIDQLDRSEIETLNNVRTARLACGGTPAK